jgi:hypothetical protein
MTRSVRFVAFTVAVFTAGFALGHLLDVGSTVSAQSNRVFELRTYTTNDGKLPNLLARFRDHTTGIFEKHGMTNVGYWVPQDTKDHPDSTLIYIISHESRDAAAESWQSFRDDPEWSRVADESQRDGRIVANVEAVYMDATDFSAIN